MTRPVTAILGTGPGNGLAFARRFAAGGDPVALCSRDGAKMADWAREFDTARGYACDVTDEAAVQAAFADIASDLGPVGTVIYNAGSGVWGGIDDLTPADLARSIDVNATGLMRAAQAALPQFRALGHGTLIVIGAGAATRGRPGTLAFAAGKAAQRSVAQSLARQLGRERIHVAYVIIDGVIDLERSRARMPDKPDDFFLKPDAIAESVWALAHQDHSAWSFEIDLRPFGEAW